MFVFTLVYFLAFFLIIALYMPVFLPFLVLRALGLHREAHFFLGAMSRMISRFLLFTTGTQLHIEGVGNVPRGRPYCYIGNHQAYADTLTMMASTPEAVGFIAKDDLKYLPLIRTWMVYLGCYFLRRDSLRDGMKAILHGVARVKAGYPMVIFPEGRRSKGPDMLPFRKGALKLATKSKALAVPVSTFGSYRILEKYGHPTPTWIGVKFHPPIDTSTLSPEEEDALPDRLHTLIQAGVRDLQKLSPRR